MDIYSPSGIKQILSDKGYFLSKTRGQNYLVNKPLAYKIVSLISEIVNKNNIKVIEVGSGLGAITIPLAEKFDKVISVEIDKGIFECLSRVIKEFGLESKINLINRDFLKIKANEIINTNQEYIFVSNLPYSVGGEILRKVMYEYNITDIFVMVQKEFFERILAKPNTDNYSFLSIMFQLNTEKVQKLLDVDRNNFFPIPSVDSTFLYIKTKENLVDKNILNTILKLFSNRRKNILNSINLACGIDKSTVKKILETVGLDSNLRIENLTPQEILNLAKVLKSQYQD